MRGLRRILLSGDTEGGVWTFALELADGLLNRGAEVCLATFGRAASESHRQSASEVAGLRWVHLDSKLEWMSEPWEDIERAGEWLREVARSWRPDLIHLNTLCHGAHPWNVPVVITHHSCVPSWWQAVRGTPLPLTWQRYRQEVERSLNSATVVAAPSETALAAVTRDYCLDTAKTRAIPNGRRSDDFQMGKKENLILSAGRLWDEAKNVSLLAEVAPHLPWPVYLAGDSEGVDGTAPKLVNCRLLGKLNVAELSKWYAKAAIYALPARYEPFGLSILEAALSGCALVLGDIASLREIWQDAAIFVPSSDAEALKQALRSLVADPLLCAHMAQLAISRAREFTQSRMVDGYISLYQNALAKYEMAGGRQACAS